MKKYIVWGANNMSAEHPQLTTNSIQEAKQKAKEMRESFPDFFFWIENQETGEQID